MSRANLSSGVVLVLSLSIGLGSVVFSQSPRNQLSSARPAETDLLGEWEDDSWEEDDRGGPAQATGGGQGSPMSDAAIGNYTGIPFSDAGRLKGTTWDASLYSAMSNFALRPHPAQYSMRGFVRQFRIQKVTDPVTADLVALALIGGFSVRDRTIWLDGRPHPPDYAEHTWRGFSTGRWVRGMLVVTTTHMKAGYHRRNGAPASAGATMTEYFIRHGTDLTHVQFIEDPAYLEEPFIRTTDFRLGGDLHARPGQIEWDNGDEAIGREQGFIPSYPLGTRHTEYADLLGIPFESTQGGKETLYPEYRLKLKALMGGSLNTSNGITR